MPNWTRLTAPATGAFNTGIITRIAGVVIAVMLAVLFLFTTFFSTGPTEPESIAVADEPAGPRAGAQLGARVADIEQRTAMELDAAERRLGQERDQLAGGQVTPAFDPHDRRDADRRGGSRRSHRRLDRGRGRTPRTAPPRSDRAAIPIHPIRAGRHQLPHSVGRRAGRHRRARRIVGPRREPRREYAAPRRASAVARHAGRAASP